MSRPKGALSGAPIWGPGYNAPQRDPKLKLYKIASTAPDGTAREFSKAQREAMKHEWFERCEYYGRDARWYLWQERADG